MAAILLRPLAADLASSRWWKAPLLTRHGIGFNLVFRTSLLNVGLSLLASFEGFPALSSNDFFPKCMATDTAPAYINSLRNTTELSHFGHWHLLRSCMAPEKITNTTVFETRKQWPNIQLASMCVDTQQQIKI